MRRYGEGREDSAGMEGGEVLMGKGNSADGCKELTGGFTASANTGAKISLYGEEIVLSNKKMNRGWKKSQVLVQIC